MLELDKIYNMDAFEGLKEIPDKSVDLVLTDPPYGIGVKSAGKRNAWDVIPEYENWFMSWLLECCRVLKDSGVLYFWHNQMDVIARLMVRIQQETPLRFTSFCIWDKGDGYRANAWKNHESGSKSPLRLWFNMTEYCLHFFKATYSSSQSGLDQIYSNPECFTPIKDWYHAECKRLGLDNKKIAQKYTEVTGKKPYMLRHYFQNNQFGIPSEKVWNSVYKPLGFSREFEDLKEEYNSLKLEHEHLRQEYESLRPYHCADARHNNLWRYPPIRAGERLHTAQKPLALLERIIKVSCKPGGRGVRSVYGQRHNGACGEKHGAALHRI